MASTQDRPGIEQEPKGSLLPAPVPASKLGQPDVPVRNLIRSSRRRPGRPPFKILILFLLIPLLMAGIIAWLFHPAATKAMITVTAQQRSEQQNVALVAVTGTPTAGQVQARFISATSTRQTPTPAPATGSKSIPQLVAQGTMTFYNLAPYIQTISPHTILTASNGVQIETLNQAVVPPASGTPLIMGQVTVAAQATQAGAVGNLAAHEVTTTCCKTDGTITARNEQAFTGGQDAATYAFIQQSDIDQAAASLQPLAIQAAKTALSTRVANNEQAIDESLNCTTQTIASPPVASKAATVNVSVIATCREETYQKDEAQRLATDTFVRETQKRLGSSYVLSDQPIPDTAQATMQNAKQGTLLVTIPVHAIWIYELDKQALRHLAPHITGKSWKEAQAFLLKQPGIVHVVLTGFTGETLPADASQITITIQR